MSAVQWAVRSGCRSAVGWFAGGLAGLGRWFGRRRSRRRFGRLASRFGGPGGFGSRGLARSSSPVGSGRVGSAGGAEPSGGVNSTVGSAGASAGSGAASSVGGAVSSVGGGTLCTIGKVAGIVVGRVSGTWMPSSSRVAAAAKTGWQAACCASTSPWSDPMAASSSTRKVGVSVAAGCAAGAAGGSAGGATAAAIRRRPAPQSALSRASACIRVARACRTPKRSAAGRPPPGSGRPAPGRPARPGPPSRCPGCRSRARCLLRSTVPPVVKSCTTLPREATAVT